MPKAGCAPVRSNNARVLRCRYEAGTIRLNWLRRHEEKASHHTVRHPMRLQAVAGPHFAEASDWADMPRGRVAACQVLWAAAKTVYAPAKGADHGTV